MKPILKIITIVSFIGLAACSSDAGQHATLMPNTPNDGSGAVLTTPMMNAQQQQQPAEAAQAPSPNSNAVPPPSGVSMPAAAPPVPAYGDPAAPRTPYFYPPVGMGVHVPR